MLSRFLLLMALLISTTDVLAQPVSEADRRAFEELQRIAAQRPAYSKEAGERVATLVMQIWDHPIYRHPVATVMNLNGGHVDRMFNRATLEAEPSPLPNFGEVDARLLRGGQPTEAGLRELRAKGVDTVVNLRYEEPSEGPLVEAAGMRYLYLPIPDTDRPTDEQVAQWLKLADDPKAGKIYVHCAWGVNRTGTMVALWRMHFGMPLEKALTEARKYGFDEKRLKADLPYELLRSFARR